MADKLLATNCCAFVPIDADFLTIQGSNLPFLSIYDLLAYFCFRQRYVHACYYGLRRSYAQVKALAGLEFDKTRDILVPAAVYSAQRLASFNLSVFFLRPGLCTVLQFHSLWPAPGKGISLMRLLFKWSCDILT